MSALTDILAAVGPIVAALAAILGGLVAIVKNMERIRRLLGSGDQTRVIVELRELADTRLEMANIAKEKYAEEAADHATTKADLDFARRSADEADRQKQRAYQQLSDCLEERAR